MAQKLWGDDNGDSEPLETESTYGPPSLREFDVSLENFTGPFDLLLRLIARRQMDLTQIALAAVTDEFLAYIRKQPDLSSATDFLVVAATLLHMKAAALLPKNAVEDDILDEDLEARDLLFARLLQYRALQQAAEVLVKQWDKHAGTVPRSVPLQEPYASLLPSCGGRHHQSSLRLWQQMRLLRSHVRMKLSMWVDLRPRSMSNLKS